MINITGIDILGIRVDIVTQKQIEDIVEHFLMTSDNSNLFIATVNPSFILKAQHDEEFKKILNTQTAINTPDGIGIQLAAEYLSAVSNNTNPVYKFMKGIQIGLTHTIFSSIFFKSPRHSEFRFNHNEPREAGSVPTKSGESQHYNSKSIDPSALPQDDVKEKLESNYSSFKTVPDRITGVFITSYLLGLCDLHNHKVLILHKHNSLISKEDLSLKLSNYYPNLKFEIIEITSFNNLQSYENLNDYRVVLCTLGEVSQEKFLSANIKKFNNAILLGIGGTFDVIFKYNNTPNSFQKMGLDWMFRLFKRPNRIKKVFNSVIVFPLKIFLSSLRA